MLLNNWTYIKALTIYGMHCYMHYYILIFVLYLIKKKAPVTKIKSKNIRIYSI